MQNGFKTPETFTEIAAVFLSLTPVRDRMYKPRLQYWGDRLGATPLADLTPEDVDHVLAELETTPSNSGKPRIGGRPTGLPCLNQLQPDTLRYTINHD